MPPITHTHTHTHSHTHTHTHILWDNIQLIYIGKDQGNGGKIREKSLEKIHVHCLGRVWFECVVLGFYFFLFLFTSCASPPSILFSFTGRKTEVFPRLKRLEQTRKKINKIHTRTETHRYTHTHTHTHIYIYIYTYIAHSLANDIHKYLQENSSHHSGNNPAEN